MSGIPTPEQTATIARLLGGAGRKGDALPLRRTALQQGSQRKPIPGPIPKMVARHDGLALDLMLLHRALASSPPWDVTRDARVWGRAMGHGTDLDMVASIISKAWRRLDETYGLVNRERSGRLSKVTVLDESGQRGAYGYPAANYFKLPFAYWTSTEFWHHTLSLPAKAVLLISLSLKPGFSLPAERGPDWYGISADTIQRGQAELRERGILRRKYTIVDDVLSPKGKVSKVEFWLNPPFGRRSTARRGHLVAVGGA